MEGGHSTYNPNGFWRSLSLVYIMVGGWFISTPDPSIHRIERWGAVQELLGEERQPSIRGMRAGGSQHGAQSGLHTGAVHGGAQHGSAAICEIDVDGAEHWQSSQAAEKEAQGGAAAPMVEGEGEVDAEGPADDGRGLENAQDLRERFMRGLVLTGSVEGDVDGEVLEQQVGPVGTE